MLTFAKQDVTLKRSKNRESQRFSRTLFSAMSVRITHTQTRERSFSTNPAFSYVMCVGDQRFSHSHGNLQVWSDIYCSISQLFFFFFVPSRAQCVPAPRVLEICHISKQSKFGYILLILILYPCQMITKTQPKTSINCLFFFGHSALAFAFANLMETFCVVHTVTLNQPEALLNLPGRQSSHW